MLASTTEMVSIVVLFGAPIIAIIGHYIHKTVKYCADNELKRAMVERGLSVEEIERILAAGSKDKTEKD